MIPGTHAGSANARRCRPRQGGRRAGEIPGRAGGRGGTSQTAEREGQSLTLAYPYPRTTRTIKLATRFLV